MREIFSPYYKPPSDCVKNANTSLFFSMFSLALSRYHLKLTQVPYINASIDKDSSIPISTILTIVSIYFFVNFSIEYLAGAFEFLEQDVRAAFNGKPADVDFITASPLSEGNRKALRDAINQKIANLHNGVTRFGYTRNILLWLLPAAFMLTAVWSERSSIVEFMTKIFANS